jgi:hypothetical protein
MKNLVKNKQGISVLITVIVMSAVMVFIAIFTTTTGIDETQTGLYQNKATETFNGADGCIEEALIKLHNDDQYSGENLFVGDVSCIIDVNGAGNSRTINVTATHDALYSREIEVEVDIAPTFNINSWQEITD